MSTFKELLEKVTPGLWVPALDDQEADSRDQPLTMVEAPGTETCVASTWTAAANGQPLSMAEANAQYIARLNPETMKLVLEALEKLIASKDIGDVWDAEKSAKSALHALNTPSHE